MTYDLNNKTDTTPKPCVQSHDEVKKIDNIKANFLSNLVIISSLRRTLVYFLVSRGELRLGPLGTSSTIWPIALVLNDERS
jgi:hypothetical protein